MSRVVPARKADIKQLFYDWVEMTKDERRENGLPTGGVPAENHFGISHVTYCAWTKDFIQGKRLDGTYEGGPPEGTIESEVVEEPVKEGGFDSVAHLKSRSEDVTRSFLNLLVNGRATAKHFELYHKLIGNLDKEEGKEEQGVTYNIKNLIVQAKKELERSGAEHNRMAQVPNGLPVLPRNLLSNPGQGDNHNAGVPSMGLPAESTSDHTR